MASEASGTRTMLRALAALTGALAGAMTWLAPQAYAQ
jgi:hypothetical protein